MQPTEEAEPLTESLEVVWERAAEIAAALGLQEIDREEGFKDMDVTEEDEGQGEAEWTIRKL